MRRAVGYTVMLVVLGCVLAACNNQPAVVVATAVPLDASFRTYEHSSGVFRLRLPSDWSIRDVSQGDAVRVEFSPPNNSGLPLTVYVLNTGSVMGTNELLAAIDRYQQRFNGDPAKYREISRNAQGDGSWRIVGLRQTPIGQLSINTFLQADGTYLSALEIDMTNRSAAQVDQMRAVINTYRVNAKAVTSIGGLGAPASVDVPSAGGVLSFSGMYSWINPQGAFVINGQVTNTATDALEAIVLTAQLYDAQNALVAEQQEVVPVEVLPAGLSAPFSIRFRNGKPSQTVRYEVRAAARYADVALRSYLGDDQFIRGNEAATYNADGFLSVSGDVVNRSQGLAKFVKAIVTVFDEQGRVVAAENVFLAKPDLLPGEATRFVAVIYELGGSAARYEVRIEGRQG